jgi:hypothetical protein
VDVNTFLFGGFFGSIFCFFFTFYRWKYSEVCYWLGAPLEFDTILVGRVSDPYPDPDPHGSALM